MTHDDLIALAARWLRRDHPIVVTEMSSAALESPDALGFKWGTTTLIECKASRADFLSDAKKIFRRMPERGMGNKRYYLCPAGMIDVTELPDRWGLLYHKAGKVHTVRKAVECEKDAVVENMFLMSVIRRIGQDAPEGISIKVYTIATRNRASLYLRED